ncbi:MAG: hypothetical protein FI703_04310 [SAR202 cluster bacterium]|jgi:hypothetical protein|nr:hypothetical protein [SAR202 cluster bacterium]
MSHRKDRERFLELRHQNPDYKGFRGYENDPSKTGNTPLVAVNCSVCGKKRNVAVGIADELGENYVCITCESEREAAANATT